MFCVKCGAEMPDGTQTCTNCGAPMSRRIVQQPRVPAQPAVEEAAYVPAPPNRKNTLPIVILCILIALVAAGGALLFVPSIHDAVFGVPELAFAQEQAALTTGDTLDLTLDMSLGGRKVSQLRWTSSAPEVASVQDGIVTASGAGTCTITVVDPQRENAYDTLLVTVSPAQDAPAAAETTDGAQQPAADSETQTAIDADAELAQIRAWYYTPGTGDVRREVGAGTNGWSYSREYLYHDGVMVFAYVYGGGEEHRLYFKDGTLFYVIETDRSEYRLDETAPFLPMAEQAKTDALSFAP